MSIQRLPTRLKRAVKRATHRKIPYLILCEAFVISWIYLNSRGFLITYWWFFTLGIGSLIWLAVLERRTGLPFLFMEDLDGTMMFAVFAMALGATFVISIGMPLLYQYIERDPLVLLSSASIISAVNAGIMEESIKVASTNTFTMLWQKSPVGGKWKILDKAILIIVGTASVAFWAWLHMILRSYYSVELSVTAFIVGMVYFALVLKFRNYLPTVIAHALYDWMVAPF